MESDSNEIKCTFCNKDRNHVKQMIAGPLLEITGVQIYICNECVELSHNVIYNHNTIDDEDEEHHNTVYRPSEIKQYLDDYVIGQDEAKVAISVAVYNHYKRINNITAVELEKSNQLMIGSSGTGKTLIVKTIAKLFDVPFTIADATTLTEAGYVGDDVHSMLEILLDKADGDLEIAQRGIIFIDEIDKIARKSENATLSRDVSGEGVQQALLKLIEGTIVKVPTKNGDTLDFDTTNILFVMSGAFVGLDNIIKQHKDTSSIGINASLDSKDYDAQILKEVTSEDLISYGIIPELVGRLPVVVTLDDMTEEMLVEILTKPKNSLVAQFKQLFELDGAILRLDDKYITSIARKSLEQKTGARGLRSIIEHTLRQSQYHLPDLVTAGLTEICVDGSGNIRHVYRDTMKKVNDK